MTQILCAITIVLVLSGCGSSSKFRVPDPLPSDTHNIPEPESQDINYGHDWYNKSITLQIAQSLDISRQLRNLFGKRKQAMNVDAFDEVPNSTWFTNRNAYQKMSSEDIAKGPDTGTGPDTTDFWYIIRAKSQGVTPGFHIQDRRGDRYVIKFDQAGFTEMATGAEVVTTKLFHAMGYNVPENYLTYFHPRILKLGENVNIVDEKGRKRHMTLTDIERILERIAKLPDGCIRAVASKYAQGKPLGGFRYEGTRKDDPNDIIPHEHRRELRGLMVPSYWLKHFDTKAGNNLDTYVSENWRSYVKHYLIDFGATLGSYTYQPQDPFKGHEMDIDIGAMFENFASLGLYVRAWEKLGTPQYRSVGRFDSHDFKPGKTKPNWPNPAFENCTNRDGYWGAKLVMSLTDDQIEAVVKQGRYSNPDAESYIIKILKERRDKTGRYWFNKVNPLDRFEITPLSNGTQTVTFTDLAVSTNLESAETTSYRHTLNHNKTGEAHFLTFPQIEHSVTKVDFSKEVFSQIESMISAKNYTKSKDRLFHLKISTQRNSQGKWSKWVKAHLLYQGNENGFQLIGIERED